jgi:hypothetical protein
VAYQRGTLQRFDYPDGQSMTVGTLQTMAALVRKQSEHPRIRDRALRVLAAAGVASMDYDGMIRAVFDFVRDHVRYVRDPVGAEYVTDPVELDFKVDEGIAAEDCESLALYASALLASIGIVSEFETQAKDLSDPLRATHCSLQVRNPRNGEWLSFDLVGAAAYPGDFDLGDTLAKPGEHVERWNLDGEQTTTTTTTKEKTPMRRMHLAGIVSASDFGDGMGDATSTITEVGKSTASGAAEGSSFGPWGALIGGALSLGGSIISAVTGKPVGTLLPGGPLAVGTPGQPLATVDIKHSLDVPTVSSSTKKILYWVAGGAAVLFFAPRIIGAVRRR